MLLCEVEKQIRIRFKLVLCLIQGSSNLIQNLNFFLKKIFHRVLKLTMSQSYCSRFICNLLLLCFNFNLCLFQSPASDSAKNFQILSTPLENARTLFKEGSSALSLRNQKTIVSSLLP